jgi:hypothetical protein
VIRAAGLALLLSAAALSDSSDPLLFSVEDSLGWSFGQAALLHGFGYATEYEDGGWAMDSSSFEARSTLFLRRRESGLEALVAARYGSDTVRVMLREAWAGLRWPGTPWIGGSVFLGREAPFLEGFEGPIVDFDFQEPDSLRGFALNAGGVLGFEVEGVLASAEGGRELRELTVDAPWLGFGTFRFDRLEARSTAYDSTDLRVVSANADFRYVRPYFLYVEDATPGGSWGMLAELRGIRLLRRREWDLNVVPGFAYAEDSMPSLSPGVLSCSPTRALLSLDVVSRRYFVSGALEGWMELEDSDRFGFAGRLDLLSEAGVSYALSGTWEEPGSDYLFSASARYLRRGAEASGALSIFPDSTRASVGAGYSPRRDASVHVMLGADLDGSIDPSGAIHAAAWLGRVLARLGLEWIDGETSVFFGGTGWF